MSKVYDIAFKIAGKLSGDFSNTFKKAGDTVTKMDRSLGALNAQAAKTGALVKLREEVSANARSVIDATKKFKGMQAQSDRLNARTEKLSRQYSSAKRSVTVYANQISKCGVPTRELAEKFARASEKAKALEAELKVASRESKSFAVQTNEAKNALERARATLDRNRSSLREMDSQMGTTGTKMQTLVQRQNALAAAADKARAAQERLAKINERLGKANDAQGKMSEMRSSSAGALMGIGATVAATAGAPVKQAMSFEDQQAELRKFSDDYKQVFSGIQKLSLQYAKSTEDMTAMAANAFQSGIAKTADEALKLVEIQNQMAIAFDMTGDEVGAAYADIQSKMGINIEQSKAMFDIVNQIGNTTSASAKDVVEVLARSGGALKGLTAMNEKQIAALAGSFRSASVSSEVASTSMMSFINALSSGEGATKGQKKAMEELGIDAGKMAHMMTSNSENAQKAIQDVFKRINGLREDQKSSIIGALFGNEAGVKSAVATLAKQGDLLAGNFAMISDPAQYAGSMLKEFQSRADTTSNSLQIAGNAVKLVAGGIGTALLPAVRKSAEAFVKNSEGVIKWVSENQSLILTAMKVGGAILGSVAAFHALRLVFALLASPVISMYKGFLNIQKAITLMRNSTVLTTAASKAQVLAMGAWRAACVIMNGALKALTIGVKLLGGALKFMFTNPIGLAILAVMALVAAGVALYKNWDVVKAKVSELWGKFSEFVGNVQGKFVSAWSSAWGKVKSIFSGVFDSLVGIAKTPLNSVISLINGAIGAINGISVDIPDWVPKFGGQKFGVNLPKIPQLAEGGIATSSTLANIGEGGEPEAVIPLSKLSSMLGSGVGMGGGITVNFAPVINVSGGSYEGVKRGLDEGRRQLEKDLRRLLADQQRLSFA